MNTAPSFDVRKYAHEFRGVSESVVALVENDVDVVAFVHREELARPFAYALDMLALLQRVADGEYCADDAAELLAAVDGEARTHGADVNSGRHMRHTLPPY